MQLTKRYIRRPEVKAKTGLSDTTRYNLEKAGKFPLHFNITPRCAVWDESEIDAWMEQRKASPVKLANGLYPDQSLRKTVRGRVARKEAR